MNLLSAIKKITTRKKKDGYYEASYILTLKEKNSLLIATVTLLVPLFVVAIMVAIN